MASGGNNVNRLNQALKITLLFLILLFLSVNTSLASTDGLENSSKQQFEIVEVIENQVTNIEFSLEDTHTRLSFDLLGQYEVELTADFYVLEGSALSAHSYMGKILSGNYEIYHLSISTQPKVFFRDIEINNDEKILNTALSIPEEKKIYKITVPINSSTVNEIIENSQVINLDEHEEIYMELYRTELWEIQIVNNDTNNDSASSEYRVAPEDPYNLLSQKSDKINHSSSSNLQLPSLLQLLVLIIIICYKLI